MPDATFTTPDVTTFTGLDDLGLQAGGQRVDPDRAVLACRVVAEDRWCVHTFLPITPRPWPIRGGSSARAPDVADEIAGLWG